MSSIWSKCLLINTKGTSVTFVWGILGIFVMCSLSCELQTEHPFSSLRNEVRTECDHQVSQLPALTCLAPQPGSPFASKLHPEMPFLETAGEEGNTEAPSSSFLLLHHLLLRAARGKWCFKIPGGKHLRSKCEEQDGRVRLDQYFVLLPAPAGVLNCCLHFLLKMSVENC